MYGGVKGSGAQEAWWSFALLREVWHERGDEYSTVSVDKWKCFEQVVPEVMLKLLAMSGLPSCIIERTRHFTGV